MTKFEETLAEIAFSAGFHRLGANDSRKLFQEIVSWAHEFEKIHEDTDWDKEDFIIEVEAFAFKKMNEITSNLYNTFHFCTDKPCVFCGREETGRWYKPCPSDDCPSHEDNPNNPIHHNDR
jgi:hypothetical protein